MRDPHLTTLYEHPPLHDLAGRPLHLADYRGQVLLLVNTASQCGFTPQYAELEALYQRYRGRGFCVIGFPCNQFGKQEPGDSQDIAHFCACEYGISFPLSEKIAVKGARAHPIFRHLTSHAPGVFGTRAIKWNFTKFIVDREGRVVRRMAPMTRAARYEAILERLLEAPRSGAGPA